MFYYSRQIVYLNFMEAGHKVRNAGFLKLEELEAAVKWNIRIKGMYEAESGFYEIRDETGSLVDKLLLEQGEGSYTRQFARGTMTRGGRPWEEICGIRITLSDGRELEGHWRRPEDVSGEKERREEAGRAEIRSREAAVRGEKQRVFSREEGERAGRQGEAQGISGREEGQRAGCREEADAVKQAEVLEAAGIEDRAQGPLKDTDTTGEKATDALPSRDELYEDKWEQLQHMYRTVHPFGDDRAFLTIAPKDFVILEKGFQKMVHNSFLLHGYYNYRHIILGKITHGGEDAFYLGVPGVYYDREKMAAEMFGFEAFEGKYTPAKQGSFGYYMKRVRI